MEKNHRLEKIALGGGCHWCTEAVYQSLLGVRKAEQGFVSSSGLNVSFSEAVIVHFDPKTIDLKTIIQIHLHTHNSIAAHSMRSKYRSAVYTFSRNQTENAKKLIAGFQNEFYNKLITEVLPFVAFKPSEDNFTDYYFKNPEKPFCQNYIDPKLKVLLKRFSNHIDSKKIEHLHTDTVNP